MNCKVTLSSIDNNEVNGEISIYPTDLAALILINTKLCDVNDDNQLNSSPFLLPYRELNGIYIIDLLYFIYFTVIENPPQISFHDRVNSCVIVIKFCDLNSLNHFLNEMKEKFTIKPNNVSGYYRIIKYHPVYSIENKNYSKNITFLHTLTNTNQIENALTLYQGIIGTFPKQRNYLNFDIETFDRKSLLTLKLRVANRFDGYLHLLNLPKPTNFQKYKEDYMIPKMQWSSFTSSQLDRSPQLRDTITCVYKVIKAKSFEDRKKDQIAFNVLMSIVQTDKRFLDKLSSIFNILKIIFSIMNFTPSITDEIMVINNQYNADLDMIESIAFWILLKISYRCELLQLFEIDPKELFKEISIFVSSKMPFLHKFLSQQYHYDDMSCLKNSIYCLFSDYLNNDDCADMWSVALSFASSFDYFISLLITVLIYHFDIYEKYQQKKLLNFNAIIKDAIEKLSPDFIISATALICSNREKIDINVL